MMRKNSINNSDFIVIQAPMVTKLNLSGNNLIIFALIYGFTKDNHHKFQGSIDYISKWTNLSKQSVITILTTLTKNGLLNKFEEVINGVKFCYYTTNYDELIGGSQETLPLFKKDDGGGQETLPNNIIYNDKSLYNNIEKEDNKLSSKKSEIDFNFIQQEWERINPNLSSIRAINPKRKNAICTLLKNNKANIDDLIMAFKIISICSFCQGDNDRKWKASFDWIINDTNSCFNRLFEGNYARGSDEKYRIEMLLKGEENVLSQENVNNNIWQGL